MDAGEAPETVPPSRRKRRAAERSLSSYPSLAFSSDHHSRCPVPLLLAAYTHICLPTTRALLKRLLRSHLSFLRRKSARRSSLALRHSLPHGLLALLPPLLASRYPSLSVLAAEIVGVIGLSSLEANVEVAADGGIVDALATALAVGAKRRRRKVVVAVCNAILDLSTASVGRERLCKSKVLVKLLSVLCQVATPPVKSLSACSTANEINGGPIIECMKYGFPESILDAALSLINTCDEATVANIPEDLSITFLILLKELWFNSRGGEKPAAPCGREKGHVNIAKSDMAEAIFRLSINKGPYSSSRTYEVMTSIFGDMDSGFWSFTLNYWEGSPFVLSSSSKKMEDLFSSYSLSFHGETGEAVVDSILRDLISCPFIISDELDIFRFLNEVKGGLGSPLLYGQDIRVVKTDITVSLASQEYHAKEVHFFKDRMGLGCNKGLYIDDIEECKQAFQEGYTIALRGMEFRSEKVAAITDALATIFGQPSVGANIYLTPPRSQGLSRHYDDHCVFVCQLLGHKQWVVFHRPTDMLPRLYEPLGNFLGSNDDKDYRGEQFFLQEGNILYIPRGYPHEAQTIFPDNDPQAEESKNFSLHLTLAVEVEPPFEWEGFAHVALHCWKEKRIELDCQLKSVRLQLPIVMYVNLLHIAIRIVANHESIFRKACLVAAFSPPSQKELHISIQKAKLVEIINKIDAKASFLEACKSVEAVVNEDKNESLQWLRWLRHLPQTGSENERTDFSNPLEAFKDIIRLIKLNMTDAEATFAMVKSEFCREMVFEDASESFKMLLEKYKRARKQYMNGMLSLHHCC